MVHTGRHGHPFHSWCELPHMPADSLSPVKFKELPPTPKHQPTSPSMGTRLQHRSLSGAPVQTPGQERRPGRGPSGPEGLACWVARVCGVVPGGAQPVDVLACPPTSRPRGPTPWSRARSGKDRRCLLAPEASPPSEPGRAPPASHVRWSHQSPGMPALPAHSGLQASPPPPAPR